MADKQKEGKIPTIMFVVVVVLGLASFGFTIAAERRKSNGGLYQDGRTNTTYCVYKSNKATEYAVGSILFLFASQFLLMFMTKCGCFGRSLAGASRIWSILYMVLSWLVFLIALLCLIAGAAKNAYHTMYRKMIPSQNLSCETLRKGVFIAAAVFIILTLIFDFLYFMAWTKGVIFASHKVENVSSSDDDEDDKA